MAENQEQKNETSQATIDTIIAQRKNKADTMRAAKIDPYPARIKIDSKIAQVREKYESLQKEEMSKDQVTVAGRMMSRRDMGKASFIDIYLPLRERNIRSSVTISSKADLMGSSNS